MSKKQSTFTLKYSLFALLLIAGLVACNRNTNNQSGTFSPEEHIEYFGELPNPDSTYLYKKGQVLFEEANPVRNPFQDQITTIATLHYNEGRDISIEEEYSDNQLLYIKNNGDTIELDDYLFKLQEVHDCKTALVVKFESNWNGSINYAEILDVLGPEQGCLESINLANHLKGYRLKTKRFNLPSSQTWTIPIRFSKDDILSSLNK